MCSHEHAQNKKISIHAQKITYTLNAWTPKSKWNLTESQVSNKFQIIGFGVQIHGIE